MKLVLIPLLFLASFVVGEEKITYTAVAIDVPTSDFNPLSENYQHNPFAPLQQVAQVELIKKPSLRAMADFCSKHADAVYPLMPEQLNCDARYIYILTIKSYMVGTKPLDQVEKTVLRFGFNYNLERLRFLTPNSAQTMYAENDDIMFNMMIKGRVDGAIFEGDSLRYLMAKYQINEDQLHIKEYLDVPLFIGVQPEHVELEEQIRHAIDEAQLANQ